MNTTKKSQPDKEEQGKPGLDPQEPAKPNGPKKPTEDDNPNPLFREDEDEADDGDDFADSLNRADYQMKLDD